MIYDPLENISLMFPEWNPRLLSLNIPLLSTSVHEMQWQHLYLIPLLFCSKDSMTTYYCYLYSVISSSRICAMDLKSLTLLMTHVGINLIPCDGLSGVSVCIFKNKERYTHKWSK